MKIVGIDFSLISTGMTIYDTEEESYKFYWFPRVLDNKYPVSKKAVDLLPTDIIKIIPYYTEKKDENTYSESQIHHLDKVNSLIDMILQEIDLVCLEREIRIEGFSYGSVSRATIDLIMYQSILRYRLWKGGNNLKIYSPSEIKKSFSGKGNANKDKMIETFLGIKTDNFDIKSLQNSLDNKTINIIKPYDDIIDSFALIKL